LRAASQGSVREEEIHEVFGKNVGSPVVATSLAVRDALDERRLVGTDASNLSALAGARAGTDDITLRTKKHKTEYQPHEAVTTPPEIILYYRLNHSIWSLSDNKESSR
jgi:hypothetical protein